MKDVLKVVTISARFPELKGGACDQMGRGKGSTLAAAGGAAWRNLLKQPKLRRKRFSTLTAIFTVGSETIVPEENAPAPAHTDKKDKTQLYVQIVPKNMQETKQ